MESKIIAGLCSILIIFIMLSSCNEKEEKAIQLVKPNYLPNPAGFEIRKGVNLSHWLSQTTEFAKSSRIRNT